MLPKANAFSEVSYAPLQLSVIRQPPPLLALLTSDVNPANDHYCVETEETKTVRKDAVYRRKNKQIGLPGGAIRRSVAVRTI
jgi:hypothetical protein